MAKCFSLIILLFFVSGCSFLSPVGKFLHITKKEDSIKQKIETNEDSRIDKAKNYVYGTKLALDLAPTNKPVEVAKEFNDRAGAVLGSPEMSEILILKETVNQLTSTNEALIAKGEKALKKMDKEIINLQEENKNLQEKLTKAENKEKEINAENAKMAQLVYTVKKWLKWIIGILAGYFLLSLLSSFLPFPYSLICSVLTAPISIIIKMIQGMLPGIKNQVGVVSKNAYEESENTLAQLVKGIQEYREKHPDSTEKLDPILKDKTDIDSRKKIIQVKTQLGMV